MSDVKKPFGIDLGTTYSAIAHLAPRNNRPEVIENREGDRTTPSVIVFDPSGEIIVGRDAKYEAVLNPDCVVEMVKRYMGVPGWKRTVGGEERTPEQLSALILQKLATDACEATGTVVEDVVITHPAYFTEVERTATKTAGQIAGLNVLTLVEEPVAAAYAYSMSGEEDLGDSVLVYDLGGGTFDACIISVSPAGEGKDIRVRVTKGERTLGGKDWDARILGYALGEFSAQTGIDLDAYSTGAMGEDGTVRYAELLQELTGRVEEAKITLSNKPRARIPVSFAETRTTIDLYRSSADRPEGASAPSFDELTADLLLRTIDLTREAIDQARDTGIDRIDTVLLVGGSSKMPQVRAAVADLVGFEPRLFEPDLAVAKGAALVATRAEIWTDTTPAPLDGQPPATPVEVDLEEAKKRGDSLGLSGSTVIELGDTNFRTISSHSLGVVAVDDSTTPSTYRVDHIILAQTPLPCTETQTYGTYDEGQMSVVIDVKEGESEEPEDCIDLGQVELTLPRPMPRGTPIEVTFTLDKEGLFTVSGFQPDTGAVVSAPVKRPATMSDDEIAAATASHSRSIQQMRD